MDAIEAYTILGVPVGADREVVKKAWRKAVRQYHPDLQPAEGQAFANEQIGNINEAYAFLQQQPETRPPTASVRTNPVDMFERKDIPDDLLPEEKMYQPESYRSTAAVYPTRGEDIYTEAELSIVQAMSGCVIAIEVERWRECSACGGINPTLASVCSVCHGFARTMVTESFDTELPPGSRSDDVLRLRGLGNAGLWGGERGDILVRIHTVGESIWRQEGDKLLLEGLPISLEEVMLGADFPIPTPRGWKQMKLDGPIDVNRLYRLREYGLPDGNGNFDDLWCSFTIVLPQLSVRAKAAFTQFVSFLPPVQPRLQLQESWQTAMESFTEQ